MKIVLHTNHCPLCEKLKTKLESKGIKYDTKEYTIAELQETHFVSMPMLEVNSEFLTFVQSIQYLGKI